MDRLHEFLEVFELLSFFPLTIFAAVDERWSRRGFRTHLSAMPGVKQVGVTKFSIFFAQGLRALEFESFPRAFAMGGVGVVWPSVVISSIWRRLGSCAPAIVGGNGGEHSGVTNTSRKCSAIFSQDSSAFPNSNHCCVRSPWAACALLGPS